MSNLIVEGGIPLVGTITPSANKNAVLPILCATLLTAEPITLHRVPNITDVRKIIDVFRRMGSTVEGDLDSGTLHIHHDKTHFDERIHRLPEEMRSSIMLIPPLLARFGVARIENDVQGCTLGVREIDPHVEVFKGFGAAIDHDESSLLVRLSKPMTGFSHWMEYASVTTTENFVMCAVLTQGKSQLVNAACEPHVQEFCEFLQAMGADIRGVGTTRLEVHGCERLKGIEYTFVEDFHEVVTFLALGAITGGNIKVKNGSYSHFPLLDKTFKKFGVLVEHADGYSTARVPNGLRVEEPFTKNILQKVEAAPWPYFPADLLPIFIALGARAEGSALFWNKVYDGALGWTSELGKFGAHVFQSDPHRVITFGGKQLRAAEVESPYIIRVAIALLMLAASIGGKSTIKNAAPIRRAHPQFVENLVKLGAKIEWTAEE
ncbi:UDP-N-acetylglucosamine 1-carboxyvinyltransferase [Parachitinimonas caeni]|uniref:UDP-N-acetylglucosamine 1-carboxyvinyltransferase n=1 Tax=Parachitinimonas caeni TaxID=3031301 RepID=A0ABT7E2Z7_9NEIS|nr:UDP-N-acetylglucosamine 1-carboxyvinyltransferase [Parachitinimonas caeni]MDK2126673.1 UDP-N-acetylglucosamine 1-carboxyvinyltransferase [Parachitinimonas caeni]